MKNLIFAILISIFVFSACNNQEVIENNPEIETEKVSFEDKNQESSLEEGWEVFVSKSIGIRFEYFKEHEDGAYDARIIERDGKIILLVDFEGECEEKNCEYIDGRYFTEIGEPFDILEKSKEESIEDAILKLVSDEGKNPENCKVVKSDDGNRKIAKIKSAEPIELTEADIEGLEEEEIWHGAEEAIINNKLRDLCSDYAGAWTIPMGGQYFIYDDENHKDIFIFAKERGMGMYWTDPSTIEFM